jgi:LysR family glycine cleavage system transcriptional activator
MTYQLPPLAWLRAFEAAARHGSFTAASTELHLTQAAVSHQVRSLERHLGFPLFERLPRNLRLTDMGGAYLPSIRKAFDELSTSTVGLFGPMDLKSLTLRAPVSYAVLWLAPRLKSFHAAYPHIDIRLCSAIWADALADERTDIDIRFGHGHWPGFRAELIRNEGAVPVCRADSNGDSVAALARRSLIHVMGGEDLWQRLFRRLALSELDAGQRIKVDTSLAALEMAASGLAPTIVLRSFAEPLIEANRLVRLVDIELPLEESHYLLIPEGRKRGRPEALLFRDWLLDESRASG